jgi:hypothetical protein
MKRSEMFKWNALGIVKISYKHLRAESGEKQSCSVRTLLLSADSTVFRSTDSIAQYRDASSIQRLLLNTENIAQCRQYCLLQTELIRTDLIDQCRQYFSVQKSCSVKTVLLSIDIIASYRHYCSLQRVCL